MVNYSPVFSADSGWLNIESSDVNSGDFGSIVWTGAYPVLVVDPPIVDFGWTDIGQTVESGVTLRNVGLADLFITEASLVGENFFSTTFHGYASNIGSGGGTLG